MAGTGVAAAAARTRSGGMFFVVLPHLLGWLVLVPIAIANGALRDLGYARFMSELQAHQLSTLSGIVLSGLFIALLARRWPLASARQAWTVGLVWTLLTLAFEFGFGHYVAGHSWARLLHDYDLPAGRVWPVFLLWVGVAPYVFHRLGRR